MTIVITGGTKGIGLAIAARLARPDARLLLAYRADEAAAAAAKARLALTGAAVEIVSADVGEIDGAARIIEAAIAFGGGVRHLVHNAAMIYPTGLLDADPATFTQAIHANGLSLFYLAQRAVPVMARGGAIVFISSAGARVAQPRYAALGTGKALAESILRYLVPELAPRGLRINAVAPGLVRTGSVATMLGSETAAEQLFERATRANPSGRLTGDDDYAAAVEYLLSPAAEFIQGQVIHINGGAYVAS